MSHDVGLIGSGPAAEAVEAALADVEASVESIDLAGVEAPDIVVVVDQVGRESFQRVNRTVDGPWVAVEIGGIGAVAHPDVDGAVTAFGPESGCYACLATRVRANLGSDHLDTSLPDRSDIRFIGAVGGRTAVALTQDEPAVTGTVTELPFGRRELLPLPGCPCGGSVDRTPSRTTADRSLDEVATAMERAVDPRVGIVREVGETDSFPAPYYLASLGETTGFSDVQAGEQAAGVAADWDRAFVKAIGESLERYAAGVYRESEFRTAAQSELPDAVGPDRFVRPDAGYESPDADDPLAWVPGTALQDDERVSLPAEFVTFPPPTERFRPAITTGLGLGSSGIEAILSGLYEVVERDATMLAWYSTYEPMAFETDDPTVAQLRKRARAEDLSVEIALVTQDVDIPVVAAAVHRDGEWPQFGAGSGASLDPDRAARSAVSEAVQNWMELRSMGPEVAASQEAWIGRYGERPGAALDFLSASPTVSAADLRPDPLSQGADELDAVLDRIAQADLSAYASRLTTRDLEQLGFEAVRVLVPEAQPLFVEERYFGDRARTVPRSLGYRPRLDREPHPFP